LSTSVTLLSEVSRVSAIVVVLVLLVAIVWLGWQVGTSAHRSGAALRTREASK
jgi:hypothetical protein